MAAGTGARRTIFTNKKVLSLRQMDTEGFTYVEEIARQALARIFPGDGCFGGNVGITATVNNKINIAPVSSFVATDGKGMIINVAGGDYRLQAVPVPPTATTFYVALKPVRVPDPDPPVGAAVINDKTGQYQYSTYIEDIGVVAAPSAVVNNGDGTITFELATLFPNTENHSGRTVRVWMAERTSASYPGPQTDVSVKAFPALADSAFDQVTVVYSGGKNKITIQHLLGQDEDHVSGIAAHYTVMAMGPTISQSNLSSTDGYFFVGTVDSNGADTMVDNINTSGQSTLGIDISSLNEVTRPGTNGDLKVSVDAHPLDLDTEAQIEVLDALGNVIFAIYKNGNVFISGDLSVTGSEIISETEVVTGDVEIGDDSGDSLTIYSETTVKPGADVNLGDGSEAAPDNALNFNSSGDGISIKMSADRQIDIFRNDATGTAGKLRVVNIGAGGSLGIETDGDIELSNGSTSSPAIALNTSGVNWRAQNAVDVMTVSVDSASEEFVKIANIGAGVASLQVEGKLQFTGSASESGVIKSDATALRFQDVNMAGEVALSDSSNTSLLSGGSIFAGINGLFTSQKTQRQNGVVDLSGLVVSDGAGSSVNVTAGSAFINGVIFTFTGTTNVPTSGSGTQNNWIYITSLGVISATTTKATAFSTDNLVLAVCDGSGANVNSLRVGVPRNTQRANVSVGNSGTPNNWADFNTLVDALNFVKYWNSQNDTADRPQIEVLITGEVDMTGVSYTLTSDHSGTIVRGVRRGGNVRVLVNATDVFTLNGCDKFTFENVEFRSSSTTATNIFKFATAASHLIINDCRLIDTAANGVTQISLFSTLIANSTIEVDGLHADVSGSNSRKFFDVSLSTKVLMRRVNVLAVVGGTQSAGSYDRLVMAEGSRIEDFSFNGGNGAGTNTGSFNISGYCSFYDARWSNNIAAGMRIDAFTGDFVRCKWSGFAGTLNTDRCITISNAVDITFTACYFDKRGAAGRLIDGGSTPAGSGNCVITACRFFTGTAGEAVKFTAATVPVTGCIVRCNYSGATAPAAIDASGPVVGNYIKYESGTKADYGIHAISTTAVQGNVVSGSNIGVADGGTQLGTDNIYIP